MGILTLLRNAFGRSRKERTAQAEGVTQETAPPAIAPEPKLPSQPTALPEPVEAPERTETADPTPKTAQVPEPRTAAASPDEHELVKAAFANVTVPKPTESPDETSDRRPPKSETPPEPQPESAPTVESKAEREPEAATEPETETATEPETAASKPETKPEAEPEAEPEATSKPAPEAGPEAEPAPKPEAEAEAEETPAAETAETAEPEALAEPATPAPAPEPAAAADGIGEGEGAPQGPPAPDNEPGTGGADGSTGAEGEAEAGAGAEPNHPRPEAPAEAPKPATTAARVRSRAPGLTTAYKAAATALKKHGLTGTRAKVHLVLDRSASMRPYYKDGSAQALAEQTLALAAHLDPEATVHVTFFSTEVDGAGDLTLTDHENRIDELHGALGRMGRTSYHAAVEAVLAHHGKEAPGTPALVVFQTDGAPDAKTPATRSLADAAANHPDVHFSFVAFGDPENKAFDYLRKLKTGNASHFLAGETPRELTDKELYEGVLAAWRP
ncbi:VWA domain-containing protein [Streptomyces sp. WG5]|uniref:VWA domain-containing protein n=1 Tax=Streptomyces sp. WG5 TaxID=3417648 RepID=UPI003CEC110D